jgi:hypothetical protein
MEPVCEHRWRYFVDTTTHVIASRRCELCGLRTALPETAKPAAAGPVAA